MKKFTLWGGALLLALPVLASPPRTQVPMASGIVEFVANRQQWNSAVLFATDVPGGRMYLEKGRLVQSLYDGKQVDELQHHGDKTKDYPVKAHAYSTTFVGADLDAAVQGENQMSTYSNFFLGNDPKHWASKVPSFEGVRYKGLYPGVDLHFYSKDKGLEYDFEVAAGADASRIALRYNGQNKLSVVNGMLHIGTSVGTVVEQKPFAYQLVDGQRQRVACDYSLSDQTTITFRLPQGYNHALPLIIDPVLVYATYSGSTVSNYGFTATYDSLGNVYSGGNVFGLGYPATMGAYSTTFKGSTDIGIIKYNPRAATGPASRVWATYLGGNGTEQPHSLLVDRFGNLIVMGSSQSTNYPVLTGTYSATLKGTYDIVITKFTDDGAVLRGSTYLGGTGADGYLDFSSTLSVNYGDHSRGDIEVDRAGNIYVASVGATGFPTAGGATQTTYGGGVNDAVVAKLNPSLSALLWSTYIGGSGDDAAYSMQVDANNNVFVSGGTTSTNLPATTGAFKATYSGATDGFVTRLSSTGATVRTTYVGTTAYDQAYLLQLDASGAVYTFGQTAGAYPVSTGVYSNAGSKNFLQKLDAQLTTSVWSTVIGNGTAGASPSLSPTALSVTDCGNILLSGWTGQTGYPVTADAFQSTGGSSTSSTTTSFSPGWFYVAQFAANATALTYATYYGNGTCHVDGGTSRFDKKGNVYQSMCVGTGGTANTTTANAWSRTNGSSWNNGTFKMDVAPLSVVFTPSTVQLGPRQQRGCAPQTFYFARATTNGTATWDFGNNQTGTGNTTSSLYTTPGIYVVKLTVTDNTQGCNQTATAVDTVKVYGIPPAILGPAKTICPGGTTTLSVPSQGAGATYSWSPATGLSSTTGNSVQASPSVTTKYTLQVTVNGCTGTDTISVRVNAPPSASAGPDKTICAGGSTTLSVPDAGTGATYLWSPATGLSSTTSRTVTASPTANTQYTVRVTTSGGCSNTGIVSVNIAPAPQVAIRASTNNVLPGTGITFTAVPQSNVSAITAYQWNFGDGKGTSTTANPTYAYTQSGSYQVGLTVTYGPSCAESSLLPITIRKFELPNVITPNGDKLNDTFKPTVSDNPVSIEIYDRWGRKVFEQQNYAGSWGSEDGTASGIYYYKISATSGETWKGWLEVVK